MLGPVFQLDGDSYTPGRGIGGRLRKMLARHATSWMGQAEIIRSAGEDGFDTNIARRLALLEKVVAGHGQAVIIGRSSGARVATLLAARREMRAAICLAYPFRHPRRPEEPERYAHLAHIRTPTLILQGASDPYGGREVLGKYALSPAVTVEFIEATHKFSLSGAGWDAIAARILEFCAAARAGDHGPAPG